MRLGIPITQQKGDAVRDDMGSLPESPCGLIISGLVIQLVAFVVIGISHLYGYQSKRQRLATKSPCPLLVRGRSAVTEEFCHHLTRLAL